MNRGRVAVVRQKVAAIWPRVDGWVASVGDILHVGDTMGRRAKRRDVRGGVVDGTADAWTEAAGC